MPCSRATSKSALGASSKRPISRCNSGIFKPLSEALSALTPRAQKSSLFAPWPWSRHCSMLRKKPPLPALWRQRRRVRNCHEYVDHCETKQAAGSCKALRLATFRALKECLIHAVEGVAGRSPGVDRRPAYEQDRRADRSHAGARLHRIRR